MEPGDSLLFESRGRKFRLSSTAAASIRLHLESQDGRHAAGVLFGTNDEECEIRQLRHAATNLATNDSAEEIAHFCRLFEKPPDDPVLGSLRPVGWYQSRAEGDLVLSEADLTFHTALFGDTDLILLCERIGIGELRFTAGHRQQSKFSFSASEWAWPAGVAAVFAIVCITAAVAFRRDGNNIAEQRVSGDLRNVARCSGDAAANQEAELGRISHELSFQIDRNRRLEAALQVLREERRARIALPTPVSGKISSHR